MRISISSAVPGAGKTRAMSRRAVRRAGAGHRILFVQPTKELIDATVTKELAPIADGVPVIPIHGGTSSEPVRDIMARINAERSDGEIICITHAAWERLPFVPKKQFGLMVDEVPQALWSCERNLIRNHGLLTKGLRLVHDQNVPEGYGRIEAADPAHLKGIMQHAMHDEVDALLADVAAKVLSRHWAIYADVEQFANLTSGDGDKERRKLILHGLLKPSLFEGYTDSLIAGADIEESVLVHMWSHSGVHFSEDRALAKDFRFAEHQNGHLMDILYLSEMPWSKRFRDSDAEGRKVLDLAREAILEKLNGQPFAYLANNDLPADFWGTDAAARRLPNTSHGINTFQGYHNVVLLSALNPSSSSYAFVDAMGLDGEGLKTAVARASYRQAAARGSIRNPDDPNRKLTIVPDLDTAVWLQGKLPGSSVANLLGEGVKITRRKAGRPRIHESEAVRLAKARQVRFRDWMGEATALLAEEKALSVCGTETPISNRVSIPQSPASLGDHVRAYATVYPDIYATSAHGYVTGTCWSDFVTWMREIWQVNTLGKDENMVMVPARMTLEGRANADVQWCRMIALDVDDGDLKPAEFAGMFPSLRMLIVNSASTTAEFRRYRVLIPLDLPVSAEHYSMLVDQMTKRLNRSGYWSKLQLATNARIKSKLCHGIDSKTCVEVLNLPAQPADAAGALFVEYVEGRAELDVGSWVHKANPRRQEDDADKVVVETTEDLQQAAAEDAEARAGVEQLFEAEIVEQMADIEITPEFRETARRIYLDDGGFGDPEFWETARRLGAEIGAAHAAARAAA